VSAIMSVRREIDVNRYVGSRRPRRVPAS